MTIEPGDLPDCKTTFGGKAVDNHDTICPTVFSGHFLCVLIAPLPTLSIGSLPTAMAMLWLFFMALFWGQPIQIFRNKSS